MSMRKLSQNEWEFEVRRRLQDRKRQKQKMQRTKYAYVNRLLHTWMPLPYLLGLIAAVTLFLIYGWKEFLKFFLSWIVSLTLVATGAYYIWKRYERAL